nr:hypothetical protein [uncultured Cohaesibacter sp.]
MKSPQVCSRLVEETESYLAAGQFGQRAQALFAKVFRQLYSSAPLEKRLFVAKRLCCERIVPAEVVLLLCCDTEMIATEILANSPLLDGAELTSQIMQGNLARRLAIAQRKDLTRLSISQLLLFGEPAVARALAQNKNVYEHISGPVRDKIDRVGKLALEQAEPEAMSQETDKLDALVSSMEQDWCAHYKPEALETVSASEDTPTVGLDPIASSGSDAPSSDIVFKDQVEETEKAMTPAPTSSSVADIPAQTLSASVQTELLLDSEDMKILDQLSESDWDALDDEAIEALARQLANEDNSALAAEPSSCIASDQEMTSEDAFATDAPYADETAPCPLPETSVTVTASEAASVIQVEYSSEEPSFAEEEISPRPLRGEDYEEEVGPSSFTISSIDDETSVTPLLEPVLAAGSREATISFNLSENARDGFDREALLEESSGQSLDETNSRQSASKLEDEACVPEDQEILKEEAGKASFTISALDASPILPEVSSTASVSDRSEKTIAQKETQVSFVVSPLEDMKSALKRPLDEAEEQLLARASQKLSSELGHDEPRSPRDTDAQSNKKAQITFTVRKSENSASELATTEETAQMNELEPKTPETVDYREQSVADRTTPQSSSPSKDRVNRTVAPLSDLSDHLTLATEDDWEKALARLTGETAPNTADATGSRVFSAPKSTLADMSDADLKPSPLADTATEGLGKVVETIENELSIEAFSLEAEDDDEWHDIKRIGTRESDQSQPGTTIQAEPLPIPPGTALAQTGETTVPEIQEEEKSVSSGFMPDMINFSDLGLIEAEPDLPSVTDLLLNKMGQATPQVELVEPIEIDILENGTITPLENLDATPMQIISEQLEAQREALNAMHKKMQSYEMASANLAKSSFTDPKKADKPTDNSEDTATYDARLSLPELSDHRVVDVEDYQVLKDLEERHKPPHAQTSAERDETLANASNAIDLASLISSPSSSEGIAEAFYSYDGETRLAVLQAMLSESLVDVAQAGEEANSHTLLEESVVHELVSARFSNDRIKAADLMHDISGHRRMDMTMLLQDKGGEALVVYLYSIGVDETATLSILLHGPDAISHDYSKITQLMTLYHQLTPVAAAKIVSQLFGEPRRIAKRHQTIHDEGSGRASPRLRKTGQTDTAQDSDASCNEQSTPEFGRRTIRPNNS